MDTREIHRQNAAAWDVTAAIYAGDVEGDVAHLRAGGNSLFEPERRVLGDLRPWCGRAIHLQCSHGLDALSLLNLGAREVVGVDISAAMLALARRKSIVLAANATWHCADVLETPRELDGTADLVYTGKGALPWIMDIHVWAAVIARLLRTGGRFYVFEGHPMDGLWDTHASEFRLDPRGDYFAQAPRVAEGFPAGPVSRHTPPGRAPPKLHERYWRPGQVINALLDAGLRLERFEEHPDLFWDQFPHVPPELARRLPHTYSVLMRKA
jgi:SAM-dependent methyltransferase